jgi:hypothetical protein
VKKDVERKRLKLQKAQSFVKGDKSDKPYDKARVSKQDAEEYFTQETMESSHLKRLLKFQDEDELGNECIERIILNLYRSSKV